MKIPVLAALPQKRRTTLFAPLAFGVFVIVFLVLAFLAPDIFYAIVLAPALGIAGAWLLLGWPKLPASNAPPLVSPRTKPFLFFPLAFLFGLVLYPLVGYPLTKTQAVSVKAIALIDLVIIIPIACALAYKLVGFPHIVHTAREQYGRIPPERRPYLFFPIFVILFLVLFLGIGALSTAFIPNGGAYLNIEVLLVLPLAALLAALSAYLLVGIPKLHHTPTNLMTRVTGKHRPRAFMLTLVLLGIPLTYVIGALLSAFTGALLPVTLLFPVALILGYATSLGASALVWGTPHLWVRDYADYTPGLPRRARIPVFVGSGIGIALAVLVAFGAAGLDFFWGGLAGLAAGLLVTLSLFGVPRRIASRRGQATLVPDIPDRLKPLILFPAWLVTAALLFATLTYSLPGLVAVNLIASLFGSLLVVLALLEQPLTHEILAERRAERAKRKAFEARRRTKLDDAEKSR